MQHQRQRGFTIVELIVVIGIIALLAGLLAPALSGIRAAGRQTSELAAARQIMIAYTQYADANEDRLLPGYKTDLPAYDGSRKSVAAQTSPVAAARYPWRIAPFLGYNFHGLYLNEHGESLDELLEDPDEYVNYLYLVSLYPSLGLNATWVGGHQGQLGFSNASQDMFGNFYITRLAEARKTDRLIVFASARGTGGVLDPGVSEGYFEVRSPRFVEGTPDQWADVYRVNDPPQDFGFVSLRHREHAVTAQMDGHTAVQNEDELRDMTRWSNGINDPDGALVPLH